MMTSKVAMNRQSAPIDLRPGKGSPRDKPERYWHIYANEVRVGRVFIKAGDQPGIGRPNPPGAEIIQSQLSQKGHQGFRVV